MAFVFTARTDSIGDAAVQTKTTASFTPTANSLLFVVAFIINDAHNVDPDPAVTDSVGLTWTARGQSARIPGTYGGGMAAFSAPVGASPVAMTVTLDAYSSTTNTALIALATFDVTGHDVAAPQAQAPVTAITTSTGDTVSLTVTLGSAPSASNAVIGMFGSNNDATGGFTAPSGFTEVTNQTGYWAHLAAFWVTGSTTAAVTCPDLGQGISSGAGIGLEITAASSGGATVTRGPVVAPCAAVTRAAVW